MIFDVEITALNRKNLTSFEQNLEGVKMGEGVAREYFLMWDADYDEENRGPYPQWTQSMQPISALQWKQNLSVKKFK